VYKRQDEIRIGCHAKTISEWLEQYKDVGKQENYTDKQIEMYGGFIKHCADVFKNSVVVE